MISPIVMMPWAGHIASGQDTSYAPSEISNSTYAVIHSVQNEHPHCDIRVRFSAPYSPRHSLQVNLANVATATSGLLLLPLPLLIFPPALLAAGTTVATVGLLGPSMAALDVTDARLLLLLELLLLDSDEEDEEEAQQGDELAEHEEDVPEDPLVEANRSRLPTCLPVPVEV